MSVYPPVYGHTPTHLHVPQPGFQFVDSIHAIDEPEEGEVEGPPGVEALVSGVVHVLWGGGKGGEGKGGEGREGRGGEGEEGQSAKLDYKCWPSIHFSPNWSKF